jgi:hypothetical protein
VCTIVPTNWICYKYVVNGHDNSCTDISRNVKQSEARIFLRIPLKNKIYIRSLTYEVYKTPIKENEESW